MSKQTRKERREEEARILADFQEALKENSGEAQKEESKEEKKASFDGVQPQTIHCRKCKTLMENGVCPNCGYKMYVPMDSEKQKKIRWIATGVCVVAFFLLLIILEIVQ
jgi:hypothetical protein